MKNLTILFILLLMCNLISAQITMEPEDLPLLGTTLTVGNTVNPTIDILSPGTGLTWDFSDLVPGSVSDVEFLDISGTEGELDFIASDMTRLDGLGNILGINVSDLFPGAEDLPATAYFSNDSITGNVILDGAFAEINIPGFTGGAQALPADPDLVYLPLLQYGESLVDDGRFEIPVDLDSIVVYVRIDLVRNFNVDAWGTLSLPDFSYEVLRIHELSSATPSLGTYFGPIWFPIGGVLPDTTITVESYSFIAEDIGYPVATARTLPDSSIISIEYHADPDSEAVVEADFSIFIECLNIELNDNSLNSSSWLWDFGDGNSSTEENPVHTYAMEGDYTLTLIASNSSTSDTISEIYSVIDCDTVASAEADFSILIDCLDIELSNNSVNAESWLWDFGDGTSSIEENPDHTYVDEGDYTITLIASNDATSDTISVLYNILDCDTTSSVLDYHLDFEIYPNPADGSINVNIDQTDLSLVISDLIGKEVYTMELSQGQNLIELSELNTGIYFISLLNKESQVLTTRKLVFK